MTRRAPNAGFTLLEMLVVISIIAILLGLVVAGGAALIGGRKEAVTQSVLQSLDRALEEFMSANQNAIPPFVPAAYSSVPGRDVFASDNELLASGMQVGDVELPAGAASQDRGYSEYQNRVYPRYPDAAVFINQVRGYGEVDAVLEGLGDRWLTPTPVDIQASPPAGTANQNELQETDVTPSVRDAWADDGWEGGQANGPSWPILGSGVIFYVHPANLLAQELYGRCVNRRPYFFSPGPDRNYGVTNELPDPATGALTADRKDDDALIERAIRALEDNLYSTPVGPANVREPTTGGSFSKEYR